MSPLFIEPAERFTYSFGPFRLNPAERTLLRNSRPVAITPKAFETLVVLVERGGFVVEKEFLYKRVWPDTFVEESTLSQNIFTLRKILGGASDSSGYIETVPKIGYRFVAKVQRMSPASGAKRKTRLVWQIALGFVALAIAAGFATWQRSSRGAARRITLAVLPFENLSGDPAQDYLGEGLTEEMITQLGQLSPDDLGVIARTTALTYRGTNKSVAEIGRELHVDYVLEGSVRRAGTRVRVSVQLIVVRDQTHLWAESYDRDMRELLSVESEVAGQIAHQVEIQLSPAARLRLASARRVNPDENELYLKGRYFWNQRTGDSTLKAREYFAHAIALDPSDARNYAGIAETYSGSNGPDMKQYAAPAVAKALALDDMLPEAHTSNAILKMYGYDWRGAEMEFNVALRLDPNSTNTLVWQSVCLTSEGRLEEGIAETKRALEIDPLSAVANQAHGAALFFARRYDQAAQALRKTLELDPNFVWAHLRLARTYEQEGRFAEAEAEFLRTNPPASLRETANLRLAHLYAVSGRRGEAISLMPAINPSLRFDFAMVYLGLGEKARALALLEEIVDLHDNNAIYLKVDPGMDALNDEAEYLALLRKAGLQ